MATNAQAHKQGQGEECGLEEKELEHVRSNLHSLKKLYSLLNVEENDPKNLDEKARILLKKLLDAATEQVLHSHSKIISGQLDAPLASMDLVRTGNEETPEKNFPRQESQDPELSCHSITRKEDDLSQMKQISQETIRGETGKFEFTATQSLHTRSGNRICHKCNRKRPNSAKVKKNSYTSDKQRLKQEGEIRVGPEPSYGSLADESDKNEEKLIDVSKEVEQAIRRIEAEIQVDQPTKVGVSIDDMIRVGSRIQKKDMATQTTEVEDKTDKKKSKDTSLQGQLVSQTRHAVGTSRSLPRQRMSQASRKIKEPGLPDPLMSQACKAILDANELPSQMRIRINRGGIASPNPSKAGKSIKQKNEFPSRLMSQKDLTMSQSRKQPIHEMLVSSNQNARKRKEIHKDHQREKNSEVGTSQPSKPPMVVGPTLMRNESLNPHPKEGKPRRNLEKQPKPKQETISKRDLPRPITKRSSFCDTTAGPTRSKGPSYQAWGGTHKERAMRSTLLPHPQKVKVSRAKDDSDSSSLLTSQDTYTDESEDPPIYHEMGPTTSEDSYTSESEDPPIYHQVEPTSRRYVPHDHIIDNSYDYASASTPDHKGHPKGRWKRLKDKLAIVFHHHHHHHHHHDISDESQIRHVTPYHNRHPSVKKDWRQSLHRPRKEDHKKLMAEIYGERVAKRTPRQHQQGHFHALLDGFLRHVWQSKKSKPSVTGIKRMGKVPKYGRAAKKLHWWQKFRKRGVKLASGTKPRVKLGFKTRRPHLQAGKMS